MKLIRWGSSIDPSSTGPRSSTPDDKGRVNNQPVPEGIVLQQQSAAEQLVPDASKARNELGSPEPHEVNTATADLGRPESPNAYAEPRVAPLSDAPVTSAEPGEFDPLPKAPSGLPVVAGAASGLYRCNKEKPRPGDCDIILLQSVYQSVVNHVSSDTRREHGGLLLGFELHNSDKSTKTAWIVASIEAKHTQANAVELTFEHDTWADFDRQTDQLRKLFPSIKRLGWYHSHPGHGIFLSGKDLNFCETFTRETGLALVVDPLRNEGGFFVRGRDAKYRPEHPQGFWESQDQTRGTLVTWKNMILVERDLGSAIQPLAVSMSTAAGELAREPEREQQVLDLQERSGRAVRDLRDVASTIRSNDPGTSEKSPAGGAQTGPQFHGVSYVAIFAAVFSSVLFSYLAIEFLKARMTAPSMQVLENRITAQEEILKRQSTQLEAISETLRKLTDADARPPEEPANTQQGDGQSDTSRQVEQQKHAAGRARIEPSSQPDRLKRSDVRDSQKSDADKPGTPADQTPRAEKTTPDADGKPLKEKTSGGNANSSNANRPSAGSTNNANSNKPPIL